MSRLSRPFEAWWYQLHYSDYEQYSSTVHGIRQIPWFVWDHGIRQYFTAVYRLLYPWFMGLHGIFFGSIHPSPRWFCRNPQKYGICIYTFRRQTVQRICLGERDLLLGWHVMYNYDCINKCQAHYITRSLLIVDWRRMAFRSFSSLTV